MAYSTEASLHYTLCEDFPLTPVGAEANSREAGSSHSMAKVFLSVSPDHIGDQGTLALSYVSQGASDSPEPVVLTLPLVKGPDGRFLHWFEVCFVLLPGRPLRVAMFDGPTHEQALAFFNIELVGCQILIRETFQIEVRIEDLDNGNETVERDYLSYQDLGYSYLQAPWLLQQGVCFVQQEERSNAYQIVRFLREKQRCEYLFCFTLGSGTPLVYSNEYDDLWDIEWERAIKLDRFFLTTCLGSVVSDLFLE